MNRAFGSGLVETSNRVFTNVKCLQLSWFRTHSLETCLQSDSWKWCWLNMSRSCDISGLSAATVKANFNETFELNGARVCVWTGADNGRRERLEQLWSFSGFTCDSSAWIPNFKKLSAHLGHTHHQTCVSPNASCWVCYRSETRRSLSWPRTLRPAARKTEIEPQTSWLVPPKASATQDWRSVGSSYAWAKCEFLNWLLPVIKSQRGSCTLNRAASRLLPSPGVCIKHVDLFAGS